MKRFPAFDKKFSDLLPWARRVGAKARKLFLRTTVAGMGTLALTPMPSSSTVVGPDVAPNPVSVAVLNRDKRSKAGKLVFHLNNAFDSVMRAAHRSHSSHSSHRSHSSHSSHSSHYSSSRGTAPSSPSPSPSYTPPPSREPVPLYGSPSSSAPSTPNQAVSIPREGKLEKVVVTIKKIDLENNAITGNTSANLEMTFRFAPATQVLRLSSDAPARSIADLRASNPSSFPLDLYQQVLVEWKFDWNTNQRVAVKFTVL